MKKFNIRFVFLILFLIRGAVHIKAAPTNLLTTPSGIHERNENSQSQFEGTMPPGHGGVPPGQIDKIPKNPSSTSLQNKIAAGLAKKLGSEQEVVKFMNSVGLRSVNTVLSNINSVNSRNIIFFKSSDFGNTNLSKSQINQPLKAKNLDNNSEDISVLFPDIVSRGLVYIPKSFGIVKAVNQRTIKPISSSKALLLTIEDNPVTIISLKSLTSFYALAKETSSSGANFWFKEKGQNFQNWTDQCFTANTQITLSSGKQIPISKVKVGDLVLSFNTQKNKLEVEKVTKLFQRQVDSVLQIKTNNQKIVNVTDEHPFLSNQAWIRSKDLLTGSSITNSSGENIKITSIQKLTQSTTVYNFEVQNNHSYIAEGFIVHNKCILRNGEMLNIADSVLPTMKDISMPNLVELEEPVIHFLKLHPEKGYLIGEHPEIANNIVSGVAGYLGNELSNNVSRFTLSEQKGLVIDLVLMTLEFGPDAALQVMQTNNSTKLASVDPQILTFINKSTPLKKLFLN